MPHIILACAFAIARQSPRPIANAVGRPVVPLVPWMWKTSLSGTHR